MLSKTKLTLLVFLLFLSICSVFWGSCVTANAVTQQAGTSAQGCVVMEQGSYRVLYEKNMYDRLPMASTTKIVTALTVIENCVLDQKVTVTKATCGVEGSSIYLREGEVLTVRELLLGLMLRSGNDCAETLALHVGGSIENFAKMMNETAKKCGCNNSNFVNPHGLHNDNHYTCAYDLGKITCYAMRNDDFRQIVSTKKCEIGGCDSTHRVLVNKNKLLFNYDGADGVKTGFTKRAGRCFVGSATKNNMQVVVVVLNCGPMFEDCQKLLNCAFNDYSNEVVVPQGKVFSLDDKCYYCDRIIYPLKKGECVSKSIVKVDGELYVNVKVDDELVVSKKLSRVQTDAHW